jgi:hypothetical protein
VEFQRYKGPFKPRFIESVVFEIVNTAIFDCSNNKPAELTCLSSPFYINHKAWVEAVYAINAATIIAEDALEVILFKVKTRAHFAKWTRWW